MSKNCLKTALKGTISNDSLPIFNKLRLKFPEGDTEFILKKEAGSTPVKLHLVSGTARVRRNDTWTYLDFPAVIDSDNVEITILARNGDCVIDFENYYSLTSISCIIRNANVVDTSRLKWQQGIVSLVLGSATPIANLRGEIANINSNYSTVDTVSNTINLSNSTLLTGNIADLGKYRNINILSIYKTQIDGELLDYVANYVNNGSTLPASISLVPNDKVTFKGAHLTEGSNYLLSFNSIEDVTCVRQDL